MIRGVFFVLLAAFAGMCLSAQAVARTTQATIFSPQTADIFAKTAKEIFRDDSANLETAMRFLEAAAALDRNSTGVPEQILRIGAESCMGQADYFEAMRASFKPYLGRNSNLEVVLAAIRCMLMHLDARLDREVFLDKLIRQYAKDNPLLGSEMATQLGLLAAEKADTDGALNLLNYAVQLNPYNSLAFEKLQELFAAQDRSVTPEVYCVHLRAILDMNPYDMSAAIGYADTLRQFELYSQAAAAYEYADRIFTYQFPGQTPGGNLYLPWLLSCYRSSPSPSKCLEVAERFRGAAGFDLMLEAVAGRAAAALGRTEQARDILERAAQKAEQMLEEKDLAMPIYPEHLAWFYSFILERPESALAWSNQAFSQAPDRRGVRAIFAYTLAQNGQYELAEEYAQRDVQTDQVAAITMALVRRQEDAKQTAIELLKEAVAMAPDTFEAEKAIALLTDLGSEYIAPPLVGTIEKLLGSNFGERITPAFIEPRQRFSAKLLFGGSDILYGADFSPRLVLENTSTSPLMVQDGAMLAGFIRVDVAVRGDIKDDIPSLLLTRFRPNRAILPNEHIFVPLDLQTGKLRRLMMTYPQASLDLEFTIYLDPVVNDDGSVANALKDVLPIKANLKRRGVNLTREFLMQRLDAIAKGQEGQKVQAAQLFTGLLAEQEAFRLGLANYSYTQVDQPLLVDAVRKALIDENWRVCVYTMDAINSLSFPDDYSLVQTLSANLNHDKWPVRFMTLHLLKRLQGSTFQPVLDWTAQYDAEAINRRLAVTLGGKEPPQPQRELTPSVPVED